MKEKARVIIPKGHRIKPEEKEAVEILAVYFRTTVTILKPSNQYQEKTPDFLISNVGYELKTPRSAQVDRIEKLVRIATKQSANIVIDICKTKITEKRMYKICLDCLIRYKKLKSVNIIISKNKVLEIRK